MMDVRCSIFKLLLFQTLVAWCGAKNLPGIDIVGETEREVQDSIRNLIHTGIYSHLHLDPSQAQVTTPVKVFSDGGHRSHHLSHTHAHGHARARRDLHGVEHALPADLHYNVTVDGRDLRLDLRPSVTFITPAMVVERHTASGRTRERPLAGATSCHYTGSVRGQPASHVALSACDGLAGLLRTEHGEYWIEPSNQIPTDPSVGRPHVIFKRSAVDKVAAYHRAKRAADSNYKPNTDNRDAIRRRNEARRQRESKEAKDKRRREYLEQRRRRLEALRLNPTEYRRQQIKLRMDQRRARTYPSSQSYSKSVEESKSEANRSNEQLIQSRNKNRKAISEQKPSRIRNRKRGQGRRRRKRNCATKQPPYQWKNKNINKAVQNRNDRRYNFDRNQRRGRQPSRFESRRSTRSVSKPRHVEVLLVADRSMTRFHNEGNLETYLLTIMNMVSSLYMDPSIGNYIKVVVVKIILVEEMHAAPALEVSSNADETLTSFCKWQQEMNPDNDENPHHHDVAILVTRQDICTQHDTPCSTLGVAHVAGMCKPDLSCSVNEDNGIMLAHTITHELGHNFGLYHDTEKIGCQRRAGPTLHIMTPIFEADTVQVAWSRCSKRDVTNFLDAGLGECLSDRPSQEEYVYPEVPAGVTFDAATQCHLQFGSEAVVCAEPSELCEHLWCFVNDSCKTMLRPAAPGTTCGPNMWCQNLTCVPRVPTPTPVDGGWGEWSAWSECSRSCGAGVTVQTRECNNPSPQNNGAYCIGDRSRYKVCNTDPCPKHEPSFREMQCAKYNNITHNNETITDWVPYFDQDKPCDLQCIPRNGNSDVEMVGGFVADGTPCRQSLGARDMCISGVCYKVGCDWVVNSNVTEDACGVCGGNGSACKTVKGIYNKGTTKQSGLSEVAIIPKGSKNVKIQEKVSPGNYISIGSAKSRKIYLNGTRNTTVTEYFFAGAQAIYERNRDWEKVQIHGPIAEDIKVYQRIFSKHRNPGVTYQYTVDTNKSSVPSPRPRYYYSLSEWTPCSATCGTGYMRRQLQCLDSFQRGRVVDQHQCYHIEPPRHEAMMQRCHAPPCAPAARVPSRSIAYHAIAPSRSHARKPHAGFTAPRNNTHWWVGSWNHCYRSCHMPGEEVTKKRSVFCVDKSSNRVVKDQECDINVKPVSTIRCADIPAC